MGEYTKFIYEGGEGEIVEKKSRFIASTASVRDEAEAAAFHEQIRKKYWDAGHHCMAFVLGERNEISRANDDGEPSGTAGRPILDVLMNAGVRNACIVVTRYFGGVLLGTGGLVRAYGKAAKEGLDASLLLDRIHGKKLAVTCDYNDVGRLQYIAGTRGYDPVSSQYAENAKITYLIPAEEADAFLSEITEKTAGRAVCDDLGEFDFAVLDKEFILL
ncbi:MAG: YigZ family protein [Lachnospiraceae bacterium]|nr:YigZ family protein [Lachnospiraceae bacterium]